MSEPFFTIGHSTRALDEFLELLRDSGVELIVDVRKLPGSTRYPQFDQDALASSLEAAGIGYRRADGLTGRRPVSRDVPFAINGWWENRSFHNYADFTLSDEFAEGLAQLRSLDAEVPAMLCSEAVWWRCHRRLIADDFVARGWTVIHLMAPGRQEQHALNADAVMLNDVLRYPGAQAGLF